MEINNEYNTKKIIFSLTLTQFINSRRFWDEEKMAMKDRIEI